MGSEWGIAPLEEIAEVVDSRHKTPQYADEGLPMVRVVDVKGGRLNLDETKKVSQVDYDDYSKGRDPQIGDLLISRVGSYGNIAYVDNVEKFCLGQNTALIIPKIHWRYLYYQLISPFTKAQIEQKVVGAVQKTISLKTIRALDIPVPPLPEQKAIAHILGTLDDKIELNRRMNATLEGMAQALFKSWFVDFDPVIDNALAAGNPIPDELAPRAEVRRQALANGTTQQGSLDHPTLSDRKSLFPAAFRFTDEMGWIPEGWEASTIDDECKIVGGGTPSTKNPDFWDDGEFPWVTPKDFSVLQDKVLLFSSRFLTQTGLDKVSSGLLPKDTLLMSSRAPVGYLAISKIETAINQGFIAMICNKRLSPEFVLQWADSRMDDIKRAAGGSTFAEISKKAFRPFEIVVPNQESLGAYTETAGAIYNKIADGGLASNTLTKLRDTLLPKLISGELRVSAPTDMIEEVTG